MWQYNYNSVNDELYHYGVLGMKWGKRKIISKEQKDFNKLRKKVTKAQSDAKKYVDFINKHTYSVPGSDNTIFIDNRKLYSKAKKSEKKTNKFVSKLNKKYGNVSAIPNSDTETGKAYCDIIFGDKKERVYI